MRNVVKEILRSLGVRLGNLIIRMVPTNDWIMTFIYEDRLIQLELTKDLLSLFRYDDGDIVDLHKEELADITEEKLREVIKEFINRKEENNMKENKIIALLEGVTNVKRVREHKLVFLKDNEEVAELLLGEETQEELHDEWILHEFEVGFILRRKVKDAIDLGIRTYYFNPNEIVARTYVRTDEDIEFFVNQVLEFISLDDREVINFTFMYKR